MIFPVIDFRYNIDLSNFFAGGKSNYMVYLETRDQKKISFNFHQMSLNVQIICICSKNAIRKNVDFRKNTAECRRQRR